MRARPIRPAGWWPDAALVVAFAVLTLALAGGWFLGWDLGVRNWSDGHRPALLYWLFWAGNRLGQGGFFAIVCALLGLLLSVRARSIRPLLPVGLAFLLTVGAITPLKYWTDRAAPHNHGQHPERFGSGGLSYPSGHLANALVWYGVLALLLTPWLTTRWRRVIRVAPPVILCVTTVYLGYHWLSDTVAGVFLGLFLDRLMRRVPWADLPLPGWLERRPAPRERSEPPAAPHDAQHR